MQDDLQKFFAHPGPRNYLRVRERFLSRRRRGAQPAQLAKLIELFAAGRFARVRARIEAMLPAWGLAPAVYWIGSCSALELGDEPAADLDRFLYHSCIRGIMSTGDGSENKPFRITYACDVDEVLHVLGLARERMLVCRGKQGLCDVAECASGEQLWFQLGGSGELLPLDMVSLRTANSLVR